MQTTNEHVTSWLDTFSPISSMKENHEALAREMDTIVGVFTRETAGPVIIDKTFQHIKMTNPSRAWPTAAQVYEALRAVKREKTGEQAIGEQRGDRGKLNAIDLSKLENEIIPKAKVWLRKFPGLRQHAMSTLDYWREPLKDDEGNEHKIRAAK